MTRSMLGTLSFILLLGACTKEGSKPSVPPPGGPASTEPASGATLPPATGPTAAASAEAPPAAKPTPAQLHQACVKGLEEAWAARDVDKWAALYAPNAKVATADPEGWAEKPVTELKPMHQSMMAAFPDAKMKVTRLLSAGEFAVIEFTLTGTNQGELMGDKPTGKPFGIRAASMLEFNKDGKIVRETRYADMLTVLAQLGKAAPGKKFRPVEPAPSAPLEVLVAAPGEEPKNVAVLKKLYEAAQKRDHKAIASPLADDAIISNAYEAEDTKKADIVKSLPTRDKVFLDQGSVVKQCVQAGEFAACAYEWTGTWKGAAMGMAPTGKRGTVHELDVARVKDGKIVHVAGYRNGVEFAVAFGVPMPAAAKQPPKPEPKTAPKDQPKPPVTDQPSLPPKDQPKPTGKQPSPPPKDQPKPTGNQPRPTGE